MDDEPNNLKVIGGFLEMEYSLSIANSGANALKVLERINPDLILLDIMMPEMDGFEVCKNIRKIEKTKDSPIIFLTAKTDIEDIIRAFDHGAVDYISKPFNPTELKIRIKNHISLFHAKKELERIGQEKDRFFSIIAHDLKNPFNSIIGFSDLLKEEASNLGRKEIQRYAEIISNSAHHTFQLLENLLTWAKMQQGRMEFYTKDIKLTRSVNNVVDLLKVIATQKGILLINNVSENIWVNADENMLNTVLRNLVGNSIKFTHHGGTVLIDAEAILDEVQISVSDNGVGIRKENLEKLFSISAGISTSGTNKEQGTGLGLILCKEFVENHGGKIWVNSEEGKGTVFHFTVPCKIPKI